MSDWERDMLAKTEAMPVGMLDPRNREIVPRLKAQRDELQQRITKIDNLLAIIEKNPDFGKFFDLARELV